VARLRADQLGLEVAGRWAGTGGNHLRADQLGVEVVGPINTHKLRADQLGLEIAGAFKGGGLLRANGLGLEVVGKYKAGPPVSISNLRINQLGIEIVRSMQFPHPAGDSQGYDYYVGPGFVKGLIPKTQPSTYEPQWGPAQLLAALGNLEGISVTAVAGTVSNVPLTGTTAISATFTAPFNEACYAVVAWYVPQNGDSNPIVVYGNTFPAGVPPTAVGFEIFGTIVSGTTTNATGTFVYIAVGL
jgi:hypothetical protein